MPQVHENKTALRAVDACGGTYTPEEEASGYAQGHRDALNDAMRDVVRADALTAELLDCLLTGRDYVSDAIVHGVSVSSSIATMMSEDLARIDAAIANATSA